MNHFGNRISRLAVRGVFWRQYLDWATINMPFLAYPVLYWFMTFFFFFFAAPARRIVLANLAIILPGSSRAVNYLRVFRTFHNYAKTISEAAIHKLNKEEFAYEIIGAKWLDQLAAAQGAIVLTAHMGNYDLGAALFAEKFQREIRLVRAPEPDRQTAQHLTASLERSSEGAVKVGSNTAGALLSFDLLNALRLGEIVSHSRRSPGCGSGGNIGASFRQKRSPAQWPLRSCPDRACAHLSRFIARSGYGSYQIIVREPITVLRTERDRAHDVGEAVEKWSRVLEEIDCGTLGPMVCVSRPDICPMSKNDKRQFYFSLFRVIALLRGGDAGRAESNGFEALLVGLMIYAIHYLFFATLLISSNLKPWLTALLLVAVAFWIWLFWLLVLYVNSVIVKALRAGGLFRAIPTRRVQSICGEFIPRRWHSRYFRAVHLGASSAPFGWWRSR